MAKQLVVPGQGPIKIPGGYASYSVQSQPGGLATSGVLMLVGEADAGPDFTLESKLSQNNFGPDQDAEVIAKYGSGPLVDAFLGALAPSTDPEITGTFSRAILVKTNPSTKAQANLSKVGGGTYAVIADASYGIKGNVTKFSVTAAQAEVKPTTGAFTYIPAVGTLSLGCRVNGGADVGSTLGANIQPPALVSAIGAYTGISASGGVDRTILPGSNAGTLAVAVVGTPGVSYNITVTRSVAWNVTPSVGDTMVIPMGSVIAGAANVDVGSYVITGVTPTVISATKLSDGGKAGASVGTVTFPAAVSAISMAAQTDVQGFSPVTITLVGSTVIDGLGKSLELAEKGTGTDQLARAFMQLSTTSTVVWISKNNTPYLLTSSAEQEISLNLSRAVDQISETWTDGGEIPLTLGYQGTTATVTITDTTLSTTVTGGSGGNLSLTLANYPTIADLVSYIAAQPGYVAAVGSTTLGLQSPAILDNVSAAGICSTWGAQAGRIKDDAFRFYQDVTQHSQLVQIGVPSAQADLGLPDLSSAAFLAGGAKGGTSNAIFAAGLRALEKCRGNFLVPLFSRAAASDIADGLTDSASTYDIASINSAANTHVLLMSQFKRQRNRQALLSIEDTFINQQAAAASIASFRSTMCFQDVKDDNSQGTLTQFLPWMASVKAAAMQAGGIYKNIENKTVNISGIVSRAGDFDEEDISNMEDALDAGLMPLKIDDSGSGFIFASDQTTYGKDDNFVFNSLQAVYDADLVSTTTAARMGKSFTGKSLADVSAVTALSTFENIMADMLRQKLLAPSDDAPKGFVEKSVKIRISGNAMLVSAEVKIANALDFVVITFLVSPVVQQANG